MIAPTLQTDRLTLRAHRADDYEHLKALWGDAEVVRHIGGHVQDAQTVWFRLLRYAGLWALLGFGMWAVEDRATGAFLGDAGLMDARRGIAELDGVIEAGWAFAPAAWGRGIASEAMAAVLAWADAQRPGEAVRCIIEPGNGASIRVAERLGFLPYAEAMSGGAPIRVMDRRAG
ncbi:RimJ/RimL family protein N-acetyltransferase [Sphingobium fontiphilum]|uniref:RimJ/RimL family protein N-acetyltransferase n=1 Tax=Sphingobium fontiphilum TaxID=944425 RepID=A0A7W6DEY6_9SPHN|nr:GNAT family N-acetyltransferase [Sphingobium fontiphilum]MBB3981532.1 RimJ/RimL family protein N-acetyltransferase [Sphingobium fontiphilum]